MEPTYPPFTTGLPTASASYLGYVAYGSGPTGMPGPTWHEVGFSGKDARDYVMRVCLTPKSKGVHASTPVCARLYVDVGSGEAVEGLGGILLSSICHLAVV